jgi:hypothetical protein
VALNDLQLQYRQLATASAHIPRHAGESVTRTSKPRLLPLHIAAHNIQSAVGTTHVLDQVAQLSLGYRLKPSVAGPFECARAPTAL